MPAILFGMPATGKTTLANKLVEVSGGYLERAVTCTTRPPRPGEQDGVDYWFLSDEEFDTRRRLGYFFETKTYDTAKGIWRYGTQNYQFDTKNGILILSPDRAEEILTLDQYRPIRDKCRFYFLDSSDVIIRNRMIERGDDIYEIDRRIIADRRIIKHDGHLGELATMAFYNQPIDLIADSIWKIEHSVKEYFTSQEKQPT